MAFGNVPKDASGIPIGGLYTPNVGFAAFQAGTQVTDGSGNTYAPAIISLAVGSALTPWTSQPTSTAASAADTVMKWGTGGTTPFTHFSIQNNGSINFVYSIDADSTAAGAKVYILSAGQVAYVDRAGSTIHCHTATTVAFGGDTGITIEAFA